MISAVIIEHATDDRVKGAAKRRATFVLLFLAIQLVDRIRNRPSATTGIHANTEQSLHSDVPVAGSDDAMSDRQMNQTSDDDNELLSDIVSAPPDFLMDCMTSQKVRETKVCSTERLTIDSCCFLLLFFFCDERR